MFRHSFKDASLRRIILANGFYDSVDMGKFKQPYRIHRRDDETMGFVGLWEERAEADKFHDY